MLVSHTLLPFIILPIKKLIRLRWLLIEKYSSLLVVGVNDEEISFIILKGECIKSILFKTFSVS